MCVTHMNVHRWAWHIRMYTGGRGTYQCTQVGVAHTNVHRWAWHIPMYTGGHDTYECTQVGVTHTNVHRLVQSGLLDRPSKRPQACGLASQTKVGGAHMNVHRWAWHIQMHKGERGTYKCTMVGVAHKCTQVGWAHMNVYR